MSKQEQESNIEGLKLLFPNMEREYMGRADLPVLKNHLVQHPAEIGGFLTQWSKDWPEFIGEGDINSVFGLPFEDREGLWFYWKMYNPSVLGPGDYDSKFRSSKEQEGYPYDGGRDLQDHLDRQRRRVLVDQFGNENFSYEPTRYADIREIQNLVAFSGEDTVIDSASGNGEFVIYCGETTPAKFVGIEIVPQRFEIAKSAVERLGLTNVELIRGTARDADFSDGTIFYMTDSFSPSTQRIVAHKIEEVGKRKTITVITNGQWVDRAFAGQDWLNKIDEIDQEKGMEENFGGIRIYRSIPTPTKAA